MAKTEPTKPEPESLGGPIPKEVPEGEILILSRKGPPKRFPLSQIVTLCRVKNQRSVFSRVEFPVSDADAEKIAKVIDSNEKLIRVE